MKYHFKTYKEKNGYWADCIELKGCSSQGKNLVELKASCKEALELYISEPEDSKILMAFPNKSYSARKAVIEISVNAHLAFSFALRQMRLRGPKTQQNMRELLGFKNLFSYQVLENPKRANPTLSTLIHIKKTFPEFNFSDILET